MQCQSKTLVEPDAPEGFVQELQIQLHMEKKKNYENGVAASISAEVTENNMQWTKYHNNNGGHGIAFEDGSALYERILGHKVQVVGMDNALNGADLVIDGVEYQLKCYKDAYGSVESCFDKANGMYRYGSKPTIVPREQYAEALERMEKKIADGKVPGVTDPAKAADLIKQGRLTHEQCLNLKKAFTKESLAFDTLTQASVAGMVGVVAGAVSFVQAKRNGATTKEATISAAKETGKTGGKVLLSGIVTQQILKAELGRKAATVTTHAVRKGLDVAAKTEVGKSVIAKVAQGTCGKVLTGAAAKTVATKAIRGNIVTSTVMFAVTSIPDTCRVLTGRMKPSEYGKRTAENAASTAGGSAGYMAGMAIGTAICPGVGTAIGGIVGGIAGGIGASAGIKKIISFC